MSIERSIQDLATIAAMTDGDDAPRLVALREALGAVAEGEPVRGDARAAGVARAAGDLIEGIVLREVEDADAALARIHEAIDFLQLFVESAMGGGSPEDLAAPSLLDEAPAEAPEARDAELLGAWIGLALEALAELEPMVVEAGGDEPDEGGERLAEIRRRIHTFKGECGVLSAHEAQALFHEAESAIDRVQAAGEPFPADEILALLDWMGVYVQSLSADAGAVAPPSAELLERLRSVGAGAPAADEPAGADEVGGADGSPDDDEPVDLAAERDDTLIEFLGEAREHLHAAEAATLELENAPDDPELINTIFRSFHTIKGVASFLNLVPIVELAHGAEFLLDAARSGTVRLDATNVDLIFRANDALGALVGALDGGPAPTRGVVHGLVDRLDRARRGEAVDAPPPARPAPENEPATADPTDDASPGPAPAVDEPAEGGTTASTASAPQQQQAARVDQSIKVSTGRLDSLVDMVGELVIAHQMVVQDPSVRSLDAQRTQRNLAQVGKITRDLQEVAMSLRMVTVRGTFQRMARLVRDVSKKAGKTIHFRMEGEETELDRNVVDEIADPLVHMVRNACDHGIESAEERRAAGKPEAGTLTLRAFHKGGSIIIEIEDDGRGLDRDKILAKAIERGVCAPDRDPSEIPDAEVFNLIFHAGLSTAEQVTDISGRGVGMDVVRRNIEALRGKVEIRSERGRGSTFMMRLPLTMAIIDGMVVRVGTQRYVIPTLSIEQSIRPTADEVKSVVGRGEVVEFRGRLLPMYRLCELFGIGAAGRSVDETLLIVLESNNDRCCLMVDEILGQQQVVIKSLGSGVGRVRGVSGGAILGDGRVALILDVAGIFAAATGDGPLARHGRNGPENAR